MLSYVVVLAIAAASGANAATTQDCNSAEAFAFNNAGNCDILTQCNAILANDGAANDGSLNNDGFIGNDGSLSNDGFVSNDGFDANTGADSNDGFIANDGASNDGFFALDAALCESLNLCGQFSADGLFGECLLVETSTTSAADATAAEADSGCPQAWIGDGFCDTACNTAEFNYDSGDCVSATDAPTSTN